MNILVNPLAIPAAPTKLSDSERDARYEIVDGQRVETPLTRVRGFGPDDTLDGGSVLPDFRLPVDTVFPADKAE